MLNLLGAIGPIAKIALGVIDKSVEDKDLKEKLKSQITSQMLDNDSKELRSAASIIKAEASSQHWLTATWRPALMWICIIVIFNNYILLPFANIIFGVFG
jgi:Tfp pilus tip-associated adhesin PilY1